MPMQGFSAKTDTLHTRSAAMHKDIPAIVIIPDSYSASKSYPVLYLLHGYSGDAKDWTRVKALNELVDCYNMFVVLPDGGYSSWYLDSPVDSTWRYETYIINELIPFIDAHYNTVASTKGRAISGLSMGGHGALYLAFRHQDVFGAAGSTSGGVDIRPFPMNWDLPKRLGTYAEHPQNWEQNTIINMLHLLQPNKLALIIDCGTSDFFFDVNCHLHQELLYRNIPHDFIARPGAHTWEYWNNSILYQALFFHNFFRH
ncbi:MAG: esterase family protein [Bacteroidales bacterium]|nr:esterase family protein [Bacteroidales bacterium]